MVRELLSYARSGSLDMKIVMIRPKTQLRQLELSLS
jgi:hypothetical protein